MSFEKSAAAVLAYNTAHPHMVADIVGQPQLSARELVFADSLFGEGYSAGLFWLRTKGLHVAKCGEMHTLSVSGQYPLARDLLKLVSYGYLKGLMERRYGIALAYPAIDTIMYAPAGTSIAVPDFAGDLASELAANPQAITHLHVMAQQVVATGDTVIHAVSPETELARQLLALVAGESLRSAVRQHLEKVYGFGFDFNWYGCCAPALAPKGQLRLTLDQQVKYQTMPEVMC